MGVKDVSWWAGDAISVNDVYDFERYLDVTDIASYRVLRNLHHDSKTGTVRHSMIFGDGSPTTLFNNHHWQKYRHPNESDSNPHLYTPKFLSHVQPDAKLVVIFRNPLAMIYSTYQRLDKLVPHYSSGHFHACVLIAVEEFLKCSEEHSEEYCVFLPVENFVVPDNHVGCRIVLNAIQMGHYYLFLSEWFRYFPRDQLFDINLDTNSLGHADTVVELWQFLGVRELPHKLTVMSNNFAPFNVGDHDIKEMQEETRRVLLQLFDLPNKELAKLLGEPSYLKWNRNIVIG